MDYQRATFNIVGEKKFGRLATSFRARFSKYIFDNGEEKGVFFRPRIKLKYNI